jgi:hypothetical protein
MNLKRLIRYSFPVFFILIFIACHEDKKEEVVEKPRVFEGFHPLMDEIVRTKKGVFRGLELNARVTDITKTETVQPVENEKDRLYFEYKADSTTTYSIDYEIKNDSLEEINVQINCNDLELSSYLFCDLKDYYANKLPNPIEDQGAVVYNCYEGQRKPFVVTLSDNSTPSKGIINMVIYKDK